MYYCSPSVEIVPTPSDKSLIGRAFQSSGGKGYVITELKDNGDKVQWTYAYTVFPLEGENACVLHTSYV